MNKVITGSAIGILGVFLMTGSAFAATTVHGNGVFSHNKVVTKNTTSVVKSQTNSTSFSVGINNTTNTGGNHSSFNTGGTSNAGSGNVHNSINVTNKAGANVDMSDPACCCNTAPADTTISGNGAFSYNKVVDVNTCAVVSSQTNNTSTVTSINNVTNTGDNSSSFNTGSGSSATSGNASSEINVTNVAGVNVM